MSEPPPTRKPYRITKQREKWSEEEHKRFTEAIEKYGRDWRRIVDHIETRTVAQVRSHAQKFFLKLEKCGKASVVPPPRPKKRAAKPYPVQDRSEERRKSKRSRPANSNSSGQSVPSHSSPSGTPVSGHGRSSARSAATPVTSLLTSSRPLRSSRLTRAVSSHKGSSQELEGNGSNVNSAHESNNELSGEPSAITQENSGQSTSEFDVLDPNSTSQEPQALPRPQVQDHASPAPDYGHLYQVVGSLFDSGGATNDENSHKQIIDQLEPNQRESLLQMMNKLTGNLRTTCTTTEQLKRQLSDQQQQQQLDDSKPLQMLEVSMPNTPPVFPHPLLPHSQLDHAASMPLMPSTATLPMPQNLTDEALPSLQPLPGSQGTALLQPPGGKTYPCLTQPCASALSDDPDPLQSAAAHFAGSSSGVGAPLSDASSEPLQPSDEQLQQSEVEAIIADQLLNAEPDVPLVEAQLFRSQPACDELELATIQPPLQLPKQDEIHRTPLDDCLAQLEDGTAPTMQDLPESEDFFDNWKIGISDPVWKTLEMSEPPAVLSASPMNSGMLRCPPL